MPNITQYDNPVDGLHPSNEGIEASVQAGRRIGTFYHQIGQDLGSDVTQLGDQYEQHAGQQEILAGSAHLVKLNADVDQQINDFAKRSTLPTTDPNYIDPNNHAVLGQAQQQFADAYDNFSSTFKTKAGQAWARENVDRSATHVYEKTAADMSTLAGLAAVKNLTDTVNTSSAAVYADPTSLATTLDNYDTTISHLTAGSAMDADTAGRLQLKAQDDKARMVKSAIDGAADNGNFTSAQRTLDNPRYDSLIGDQKGKFQQEIDERQKQWAAGIRGQQEQAQKALELQGHAAYADIITKYMDPATGNLRVSPAYYKDVIAFGRQYGSVLPAETEGLRKTGVDDVRRQGEADPGAQAANFHKVILGIAAGKTYTPAQLFAAVGPTGLSAEGATKAMELSKGPPLSEVGKTMFESHKTAVEHILSRRMGLSGNDAGAADIQAADNYYTPLAISRLQAGADPAKVFDQTGRDPLSIYNGRPISSFKGAGTSAAPHPNATTPKSGPLSKDATATLMHGGH